MRIFKISRDETNQLSENFGYKPINFFGSGVPDRRYRAERKASTIRGFMVLNKGIKLSRPTARGEKFQNVRVR